MSRITKILNLNQILKLMNTFLAIILIVIVIVILTGIIAKFAYKKYSKLHSKLEAIEKNIIEKSDRDYNQVEALTSLYHFIKPLYPLPRSRGWAASPDFLELIFQTIINEKPKTIVEAGSGLSSLIVGYTLKQYEINGKLITFDDKFQYAEKTKQLVEKHNLSNFVNIINTEIQDYNYDNISFKWYDSRSFESLKKIDLLIIDGPGSDVSDNPRYGALPLLYSKLSLNATTILDDGNRKTEGKIVEAWLDSFDDLKAEYIDLEKGAYILRRIN